MTSEPAIHVLLVEDDEGSRRSIQRFLNDSGLTVTAVADAAEANRALDQGAATVVVTDYKLPGVDGIQFVKNVKERFPSIPCLMITAHGDVQSAVQAMQAGAVSFLEKPVPPNVLLELIRRAWEKHALGIEVERLRRQLDDRYGFHQLVGSSRPMVEVFEKIKLAAPTASTVLITGESGTGKELVARALHQNSPRARGPFVAVNCAALPESLVESELFGHEKGAYTGAAAAKKGYFEAAQGGTLLIDEIGDLAGPLQAKLLRALEQRVIHRVGSTQGIDVDVRIIAATHQDLETAVRENRFRADLFYRISVVRIHLPALRERRGDIPLLAAEFLQQLGGPGREGRREIHPQALEVLQRYDWPGNVRELKNLIESALVLNTTGRIEVADLPERVRGGVAGKAPAPQREPPARPSEEPAGAPRTLAEIEKQAILDALEACDGNRTQAAYRLGIGLRTVQRKLKEYGYD